MCVPNVIKNKNAKVFNLISRSNQKSHIEWHETCKCKCRPDSSVCNDKQRWNEDKYRCECKEELIDKGRFDKGFIWNPSDCNCECDNSCDVKIYENAMIYNENLNDHIKVCSSCTICIILFAIF